MRDVPDAVHHLRYAAPAFVYPVRRSGRLLVLVWVWNALLLGALLVFMLQMQQGARGGGRWYGVLALFALALCFCALNVRWWLKMPAGCLQWDQKKWGFRALSLAKMPPYAALMGQTCTEIDQPVVLFDFQWAVVLVVKVHASASKTFMWVERQQAPAAWLDVRRALSLS